MGSYGAIKRGPLPPQSVTPALRPVAKAATATATAEAEVAKAAAAAKAKAAVGSALYG